MCLITGIAIRRAAGTRAARAWPVLPRLGFVVLAGWLVGACYAPTLRDCAVTCAAATECGGGQICGADGFCAAPDVAGTCGAMLDAAPATDVGATGDAPPPDASLCALGCSNGTCVGGVCVIDCSAPDSCPDDIVCAPNVPCRVLCGDRSCDNQIKCELASSCDIRCMGLGSCGDELICGKAPCTIACSGEQSCARRVKCKEACSCDVSCSGLEACGETPECPHGDTCRLGAGCTSSVPACNACP